MAKVTITLTDNAAKPGNVVLDVHCEPSIDIDAQTPAQDALVRILNALNDTAETWNEMFDEDEGSDARPGLAEVD